MRPLNRAICGPTAAAPGAASADSSSDPVGALAHARDNLAAGGLVVAVEPFAEDRFEDNLANPVALTFYVGSSALCVPHSISDGGAALGAQAGPARLTAAFVDGGFGSARVAAATPYNLVIEARA